jgi:LmbE family N-acetylglucosaminyl deacetylase
MALYRAVPGRALACFAHPDDPEVACAGTLGRWADAGCEVRLVIASAGEKGTPESGIDPVELAARRAGEARAAATVLGVASVELLGHPDGEIENTVVLRRQLIGILREARPEVVIAPDPTAVFFGSSYVNHHDHRALGWAVLDACAPMAASPLYEPDTGPPHQVGELFLAGTLAPDTWVDMEAFVPAKVRALRCHASQLGAGAEVLEEVVEARAAEAADAARAAGVAGLRYAEGFRRITLRP